MHNGRVASRRVVRRTDIHTHEAGSRRMKMIMAIIKPFKLYDVREALS